MGKNILLILLLFTIISCTSKQLIEEINPNEDIESEKNYENYSFNIFFHPSFLHTDTPHPVELILTDQANDILLDTILERDVIHTINYKSPDEKINLTYILQNSSNPYVITFYEFTPKDWAIPYTIGFANRATISTPDEETEESVLKLVNLPGGQTSLDITSGSYGAISSGTESTINYKRRISGEYLFLASGYYKKYYLTKISSSDTTISLKNMQDLTKIDYSLNVDYPLEMYYGYIHAYPNKSDASRSLLVFEKYNYLYDENEIYCPLTNEFEEYQTTFSFIDKDKNEHSFYLAADSVPTHFDIIDKSDITIGNNSISIFDIKFENIKPSYYSTYFKNDSLNVIQYLPSEMNSYSPDSLLAVIKSTSFVPSENYNNLALSQVSVEITDAMNYQEFLNNINVMGSDRQQSIKSIKKLIIKFRK